jgi:DNA-binding transcriptional LysR family regulator
MINFRLIRHLWLFLAVAEEQHFGRAAKRLGMTQPPLTEQIQVLEQALKVRLFDRSRRGAQLTPAGRAILPAVRTFADQLERLELAVREACRGQRGVLTIGAIATAMLDVLPPLIEWLKAGYPALTVSVREIDSGEAAAALAAGEIDLAFVRLEGELGRDLRVLPLREERLAVALPSRHPLAALAAVPLIRLSDEDFVMFSRRLNPVSFDTLLACCRASGFAPRILHEARTVASQVAFVACGQGVALVPLPLERLAPENVVVRPLVGDATVVTTALVWDGARAGPLVEAVVARLGGADA